MNRKILHILGFLLSLLFAACSIAHDQRLQDAESIMSQRPDSALTILEGITERGNWNRNDSMFADLLTLQAKDKMYVPAVSDSIIRRLLKYYIDENHESRLHPLVLYYAGRTYYDLGHPDLALRYFRQAIKTSGKNGDPDLLEKVHSQMGGLYFDNRLYRHALRHTKEQLKYCQMLPDSSKAFNASLSIAFNYRMLSYRDSARMIYDKLGVQSDTLSNEYSTAQYYMQLASFLYSEDKWEEADSIIHQHKIIWKNGEGQAAIWILNNIETHRGDSSNYESRLKSLLNSPDIKPRQQGAKELAKLYRNKGKVDSALYYASLYESYTDTILNRQSSSPLAEVEAMLLESELENDNLSLRNEVSRRNTVIIITVSTILLLFALLLILRTRSRLRLARKELELTETRLTLQDSIKEAEEKFNRIMADIDTRKIVVNLMEGNGFSNNEEKEETLNKLMVSLAVTDSAFIERLKKLNLQKRDMDDAMLIRLGVPQKTCALIFNLSTSGLGNARNRLLKAKGLDADFSTWTDFIMSI